MSDSEQRCPSAVPKEKEEGEGGSWPDSGGVWEEEKMDCGLQAMAEEDEDIDFYNDETFGMDLDVAQKGSGVIVPPPPPIVPRAPRVSPPPRPLPPSPPPRQKEQLVPLGLRGQRSSRGGGGGGGGGGARGYGVRGGRIRAQMFEDPAVVRTVEGRPSIKTFDSAIVDCGAPLPWATMERAGWMGPSCRKNRMTGSILEDNAIVCVIDGHGGRGHRGSPPILHSPYPSSGFRARGTLPRGEGLSNRLYSHRPPPGPSPLVRNWMNSSTIPGSLVQPRQTAPPQYSQPQTPKMMHLRFGANSPGPSPYYSPSSTPVQPIRYPGPVTQLHPQHKRLLSQKRTAERKAESWDPYCHLMTEKEKEWITRLQMIQLQTENPDLEDYYYQEYYRRMEDKLVEEELGMRSKRDPPKLFTPYITKTEPYTPVVHIEGSLGQVAVSTCYSPRRAIGAVNANPTHGSHEEPKDVKTQQLEVLMQMEKLFVVLLEVEEEDRMKGKVLAEAEEKKAKEKTRRKVQNILSQLQHYDALETGVEFLSCLMFSKGKKLISRLLPFLDQAAGLRILTVVTSHIPTLISRDTDEVLPVLYPSLRTVISMLTFSQLIVILKNLTSIVETPEGPGGLLQTCQNKFGLSLLYALLSQGERLLSSGSPLDPSIGDFESWTDTIFQVAGELSHCTLVEPLLLPSNLLTLFCRYLDKRTVHQLKSNMEFVPDVSLQGKHDVCASKDLRHGWLFHREREEL
ncbi:unnamed protein product [Boreogadus saida]